MLVVFFIIFKKDKNKLKYLFIAIISIIICIQLISYIPAMQVVFEKFDRYAEEDNLLNGRTELYEQMWEYIQQKPILGNGIVSSRSFLENDGHNIYIQTLCELGIVGTTILIYSLLKTYIKTYKNLSYINEKKYMIISIYFQTFFIVYGMSGNPFTNIAIFIMYISMASLGNTKK